MRKDTRSPDTGSKSAAADNDDQERPQDGSPPNGLDARRQETHASDIGIYLQNEAIIVKEATEPDADTISSGTSRTAQYKNDDTQVSC